MSAATTPNTTTSAMYTTWHNRALDGYTRRLRSPEDLLRSGLKACLRSDAVGDRPVVAGDYGRGVVDLVDEHGEGAGDPGLAGGVEGDGERGGGEGDGSG